MGVRRRALAGKTGARENAGRAPFGGSSRAGPAFGLNAYSKLHRTTDAEEG